MSTLRRRHLGRSARRRRHFLRVSAFGSLLLFAIVAAAAFAFTTTITGVSPPALGAMSAQVTGYALEPAQCKTYVLNPTAVVLVNTTEAGTNASEIVIGVRTRAHPQAQPINGGGGDDCVLSALNGLADYKYGGTGTDVCIGGQGEDYHDNPPGCDYAYHW